VQALLDELEARGLLCEERFMESRVHAREARFGNRRIEAELARHGLELAPEAAEELRRTELDRARAVWARRYGAAEPDRFFDAAETARQMRFLAARGFSPDVIRRVVKGGLNEE
jgi:regulatory protein